MAASKTKYLLAGVLSTAIWGFFSIPLRSLKFYPSSQILYYRIFVSLLVIWAAIFLFRKAQLSADIALLKKASTSQKRLILLQVTGATVLLVLNWYAFIYAINHISIKAGAFAYMVCPLITAFGGFIILKEQLSKLQGIALAVASVSIFMLGRGSVVEVIWSIVIAALYAFYLIIQRKMQGLDKLNVLAFQITIAVLLMLPFYITSFTAVPSTVSFWLNIVVIAILFTVVPLFLSLYALIGIPSSTLGIIIYVNPIIAFCVAIFHFGEQIDPHQVSAYLLLVFAVLLFNWGIIKDIFTFRGK